MRLLTLLALCQLHLSAFAQSVPSPMPTGMNGSLTVLHPSPGVTFLYDQRGNSAMLSQPMPGTTRFSVQDRYGTITSQGYVFEPLPVPIPLDMPRSSQPAIRPDRAASDHLFDEERR